MGAAADVRWDELKPVLRLINERLDHIEEFLVRSAARNGPAYSLFVSAACRTARAGCRGARPGRQDDRCD
jgi:hypothetical protein